MENLLTLLVSKKERKLNKTNMSYKEHYYDDEGDWRNQGAEEKREQEKIWGMSDMELEDFSREMQKL